MIAQKCQGNATGATIAEVGLRGASTALQAPASARFTTLRATARLAGTTARERLRSLVTFDPAPFSVRVRRYAARYRAVAGPRQPLVDLWTSCLETSTR